MRAYEKPNAAEFARQVVAELKIEQNPSAILDLPAKAIVDATDVVTARNADPRGFAGRSRLGTGPVLDGVTLPRHPVTPMRPRSQPTSLDDRTQRQRGELVFADRPTVWQLTESDLEKRLDTMYGPNMAEAALELHKAANPKGSPSDILADIMSGEVLAGTATYGGTKSGAKAAPVYYYILEWETPEMGGLLRSSHGLDLSLVLTRSRDKKHYGDRARSSSAWPPR